MAATDVEDVSGISIGSTGISQLSSSLEHIAGVKKPGLKSLISLSMMLPMSQKCYVPTCIHTCIYVFVGMFCLISKHALSVLCTPFPLLTYAYMCPCDDV